MGHPAVSRDLFPGPQVRGTGGTRPRSVIEPERGMEVNAYTCWFRKEGFERCGLRRGCWRRCGLWQV
jgi:hypothetical protein